MVNQSQPAFIKVIFHSVAEKYFKCGLIYCMISTFGKTACLSMWYLAFLMKISYHLGRWVHSLRETKG